MVFFLRKNIFWAETTKKTVASSKNRNFARMEVPGIWYCNIVLYRVLNFPLTYVVCPHCGVFTVRVKGRDHIDQATLSGARHFCCKFSGKFSLVRSPCGFRLGRQARTKCAAKLTLCSFFVVASAILCSPRLHAALVTLCVLARSCGAV